MSELDLLGAGERAQVLHGWNDTAADFPAGATLHGLIEAQARPTPDAVAVHVRGRDRRPTRELDARANRVAHRLRAAGVGPAALVAVCAERSAELVVALLGVLKAGAAYLPLDPDYPADRLAFMLADAAAPVVLVQARLPTCCRAPTPRCSSSTTRRPGPTQPAPARRRRRPATPRT